MSHYLITDVNRRTGWDAISGLVAVALIFGFIFAFGSYVGGQQIERERMHEQCRSVGGHPSYDSCFIDGKEVTLP